MTKPIPAKNKTTTNSLATAPELPPDTAARLVEETEVHPASPVMSAPVVDTKPVAGTEVMIDDDQTDVLVDDIIKRESNELLAAQDGVLAAAHQEPSAPAERSGNVLGRLLVGWWRNPFARYGTAVFLFMALTALGTIPTSRYLVLNSAGVRSEASLSILDNTTNLPLRNVSVELGGITARSDENGVVRMRNIKLGPQALSVSQAGFATISRTVTLGLGSNPLGDFTLHAIGAQFRFKLTDYLSGKPIGDAEITSGSSNASADTKGQLVLTISQDTADVSEATISADGYRSEKVSLDIGQKQSRSLALVPGRPELYVSKQSGKYDVYRMDIDGNNRRLLLPASGHEDGDISLVVQAGGQEAALVSRRDTTINQDGFPLQSLTLINIDTGDTLSLDRSERIQIVDWIGNKLIYVKIKAGTSAGNPDRYQLMSYDYDTTSRLQLATANSFNDVISAKGALYYAASNDFQGGVSQFVKLNPDSTGKQVILDKTNVWNAARNSYDGLELSALDGLYRYAFGESSAQKTATSGNFTESKFYLDSPDGKQALVTDTRDGKGFLLLYDAASSKETVLASLPGLTFPVRWLNDRTVLYRVASSSETADYAISLDGGSPRKLTDLTNVAGYGRWNYR